MLLSPSEKIFSLTGLFNINLHYANIEAICSGAERGLAARPLQIGDFMIF